MYYQVTLLGLLIALVMLGLPACTTEAWRASTQEVAKQQCEQAPATERDRCLDKLQRER